MQKGHWPNLLLFARVCMCPDLNEHMHRYMREHGLDLTATLYLPPGYDKERDGRLPCE